MKDGQTRKTHCSISSIESKELMFGTAPVAPAWFLIEYRGNFSGKAFEDSKIPKTVKSHLKKELKQIKGCRLQLIKKHQNEDEELRAYLAISDVSDPKLYEIKFKSYEELLSINLKKIIKSDTHICHEKIYIVCTNGEYDTCCGKFGMPVYLDLAEGKYKEQTWEANHIGGHRFAATFVCLPEGIVYGRVKDGSEAEEIIELHEQGEIDLERFRGRSCYPCEVQAAEYYLRRESGVTANADLIYKTSKKGGKKLSFKFYSSKDQSSHRIKIGKNKKGVKVIKSCGDGRTSVPQYILVDHKID